ncbi:Ribose-phosphate pyrophosphokinase 2, chloroplastic [Capsicum baccatum]|uniref:ribose-phosphate diphosphokinase n=1 Tax=Capsicum baccatum TaxID=33114 RepID=A0A2G2WK24_CAPBA|nr:Ribose-phosphate pyrophosphokinase 2, chloroplastic [Capsicum baccatum]
MQLGSLTDAKCVWLQKASLKGRALASIRHSAQLLSLPQFASFFLWHLVATDTSSNNAFLLDDQTRRCGTIPSQVIFFPRLVKTISNMLLLVRHGLGNPHYFLGVDVISSFEDLVFSLTNYVNEILTDELLFDYKNVHSVMSASELLNLCFGAAFLGKNFVLRSCVKHTRGLSPLCRKQKGLVGLENGTGQFLSIIVTQKELMVKKLFKQLLIGDSCVMCTAGNKYLTKLRTTEYFDDEFKPGFRRLIPRSYHLMAGGSIGNSLSTSLDVVAQSRQSIAAKLVGNIITEAGADRVLACDLHSGQSMGYFDIPVDHLYCQPVILDYLASKKICSNDLVVVSPDVGGVARARAFAKELSAPLAIVDKRRQDHNLAEVMNLIGDVKGKVAVMVDDMIDTAGTIAKGAELLHEEGAREIYACCTHGVFSPPAVERLSSGLFQEVITTNTIPVMDKNYFPQLTVLSVANLLGETIWRIHGDRSVTSIFQ